MRIAEIFHSIQGEGKLAGIPSVFVRVSGCNLRCQWCDTPYASHHPQGDELSLDQIVERVKAYGCRHVVLTGGEPVIMPEVESLCLRLMESGAHLTIESAGTVYKPLPANLISLSPKLSNSAPAGPLAEQHEKHRLNVGALQRFLETSTDLQMKFVVARPEDLGEVDELLGRLRGWRCDDVLLMPEGKTPEELAERSQWLIDACVGRGFRFCARLQVMVWGNRRGV